MAWDLENLAEQVNKAMTKDQDCLTCKGTGIETSETDTLILRSTCPDCSTGRDMKNSGIARTYTEREK